MSGNESAERLVEENIKLVPYLAHKYLKNTPGLSIEDLVSAGNLGLWKAAQKYNPDYGVKFITFAARCILNDMGMALRREKKHGYVLSLDAEAYTNATDGSSILLQDLIPSKEDGPEKIVEDAFWKERLYAALSELPEKDRYLLFYCYGLGSCEKKTQARLAEELGTSQSYMSRKKNAIVNRLSKMIMQEKKACTGNTDRPTEQKEKGDSKLPTIDLSAYQEVHPQSKRQTANLTVTSAQRINVGRQIYDQAGAMIRLFVGTNGKSVVLLPTTDKTAFRIGKTLSTTAHALYEAIIEEGIAIPARYEMRYVKEQNAWLGTLVKDMKPARSSSKKTKTTPAPI